MTITPKQKIEYLIEKASDFKMQGRYSEVINCLLEIVDLMAKFPAKPDLEGKPPTKPEGFDLVSQVAGDSFKRNLTDIDQMVIWKLGLAAWDAAKKWKAKFPHE